MLKMQLQVLHPMPKCSAPLQPIHLFSVTLYYKKLKIGFYKSSETV